MPIYKKYLKFQEANALFSQENKQLLLKIPHEEKIKGFLKIFKFKKSEDDNFQDRIELFQVLDSLPENYHSTKNEEVLNYIFSVPGSLKKGDFYITNKGPWAEDIINSLWNHSPEDALKLKNNYFTSSIHYDDVTSMEDRLVKTIHKMHSYLKENNLSLTEYPINNIDDVNTYLDSFLNSEPDLPSYNDFDYQPFLLGNDYCINDYSAALTYVVKNDNDSIKIYVNKTVDYEHEIINALNDGSSLQKFFHIHSRNNEKNLIGEIKNGKIIKASNSLVSFEKIQNYIFNELLSQGLISDNQENDLSFEQLLKNYTLQKEFYCLEERAILPLLEQISYNSVSKKITYPDFSLMNLDSQISNETMKDISLESITDDIKINIQKLPVSVIEEINIYFHKNSLKFNLPEIKFSKDSFKETTKKSKRLKK